MDTCSYLFFLAIDPKDFSHQQRGRANTILADISRLELVMRQWPHLIRSRRSLAQTTVNGVGGGGHGQFALVEVVTCPRVYTVHHVLSALVFYLFKDGFNLFFLRHN
jgi:hypothetical protein